MVTCPSAHILSQVQGPPVNKEWKDFSESGLSLQQVGLGFAGVDAGSPTFCVQGWGLLCNGVGWGLPQDRGWGADPGPSPDGQYFPHASAQLRPAPSTLRESQLSLRQAAGPKIGLLRLETPHVI